MSKDGWRKTSAMHVTLKTRVNVILKCFNSIRNPKTTCMVCLCVAGLAQALKENTTLTRLDLANNNIHDQGAAVLTEALKENTTLTRFGLANNNVGDLCVAGLAKALKGRTKFGMARFVSQLH